MSHVPLLTGSSPAASPATQSADNTPSNSDNSGHYAFTRWQPHDNEEQEILVDSELDCHRSGRRLKSRQHGRGPDTETGFRGPKI